MEDSRHELLVSAASAWEIATKWRLGKLAHAASVVHNYHQAIHGMAATELPISAEAARRAGLWQVDHRAPFDRILAAQAAQQELVLAKTDTAFSLFAGVERLS